MIGRPLTIVVVALMGLGCARNTGEAAPRETLRRALLAMHQADLRRDPGAVAEKLRRMARGNFAFFRGAIGLHKDEPTRFETAPVAIIGDPHPENVGTFPGAAADGDAVVDFNDFDQAGFGSFIGDLRRLSLGLFIVGDAADVPKKHRVRLVQAAVSGYVSELAAVGRGEPPVALRAATAFGGAVASILEEPDARLGDAADTLAPAEHPRLERALRAARATLHDPERFPDGFFVVKRAVRAQGGIASWFLRRIRVAVEGPGPGNDDDVLLELKESPPGSEAAKRLVRLQRELQERADQDPLLGHTELEGKSYRLRSFGPGQRSVSVERIAREVKSPRWGKKDLREFAHELGRLLARGHARARGPDGQPGLIRLVQVVGDGSALKLETANVTTRAAERLEADVDHLRALLAERGPTLGFSPTQR